MFESNILENPGISLGAIVVLKITLYSLQIPGQGQGAPIINLVFIT